MNIPPPPPINALVTALQTKLGNTRLNLLDIWYLYILDNLEIPNLHMRLNARGKELLDKLKKYEVVYPQDVSPISNKFADFYGSVGSLMLCYYSSGVNQARN